MDTEALFRLANVLALPGWIALAAAPWRRAALIRVARVVGASLAIFYLVLLLAGSGSGLVGVDYSAAGLAALFSRPEALLIGWVHYLAFDLWVGSWEAEEAERTGVPHLLLLPCLFLTFLLGPVGLLAFLAARAFTGRRAAA
jgi:hypothetical protein